LKSQPEAEYREFLENKLIYQYLLEKAKNIENENVEELIDDISKVLDYLKSNN
jgi:hypothetical protein